MSAFDSYAVPRMTSESSVLQRSSISRPKLRTLGVVNYATAEAEQCPDLCGHGQFQWMALSFSVLSLVVLQCYSLSFTVIARGLDHWCKPPEEFSNLSVLLWKDKGIPLEADGTYSRCTVYNKPEDPNRYPVPCTNWDYDEERRRSTIVSYWNLVCSRQWMQPLVNAVFMAGALIAVPIVGHVADRVGRRPVVCASGVVLVVTCFVSCFTLTYPLFLFARFIISGCVSTIFIVTFILLFEISTPDYRTFFSTITTSLGVVLVYIFFSVLRPLNIDWYVVEWIFMAPTSLLLSAFFVIDESPRWLMATLRMKKAEVVIRRAAHMNGFPEIKAMDSFLKLKEDIEKDRGLYDMKANIFTLLRSQTLRCRTLVVFFCSFAIMFSFYALALGTIIQVQTWANITGLIFTGPAYVWVYYSMNAYGRRTVLKLILWLLGGACCLISVSYDADPPALGNGLLLIAQMCASVAVTVNYIYQAELFPTVVRSDGICCGYTCGRLGAAIASLLTGLDQVGRGDVLLVALGFLCFTAALLLWLLPETLECKTADTVRQAEKDDLKGQETTDPMTNPRSERVSERISRGSVASLGRRESRGSHRKKRAKQ